MLHKDIPADQCHVFPIHATFTLGGDLALHTGEARWYPPRACYVSDIAAWVSTAPVGADVDFSINKNGVELVTGSIVDGAVTMTPQTGLNLPLLTTDYLTVDVDQVGSTMKGKNLTIRITML